MKKNRLFFILIIFIFAISIFSLCFYQLDPDYLWHIKAGEYMFHNSLLRKDIFSWYLSSKYWMSHEWLFEYFIYLLKYIFGNYHIFVYCFLTVFLLNIILFISNRKEYQDNILFTIVWIVLSLFIAFHLQARPHMVSFCLLALTLFLLFDNYHNKDSIKIYFLPLISILWANFHGGSSNLPYLLCALFFFGGLFKFKYNKIEANGLSKKQLVKYLYVMFLCMIAVCINIHGFKMFIYPYENIVNNTMINNITEWQSTSLGNISHYPYFILIIFIGFWFIFSKKKIQFIDLLLFGFCVFLGLKSIRFWYYTYIISSFFIFNYFPRIKEEKLINVSLLIFSCFFVGLFIFRNYILNVQYHYLLDNQDIKEIKKVSPSRLFNMYDYGGDLIYNSILVFIDGRADLYSNYNYNDYLDICSFKNNAVDLINKYDFDYLLVDSNYPITSYLKISNNYELIYSNGNVLLFKNLA